LYRSYSISFAIGSGCGGQNF